MFSPLLQSIIDRNGYTVVDQARHDAVTAEHHHAVLFFAGDAARLAESDDVAVVLPELHKAFGNVFAPLIVARDSERILQRRYRFNSFPTLVFLRHGDYLGAIQNIRDWADYLREIAAILERDPSEPPPFKFPEGCGAEAPHHSH